MELFDLLTVAAIGCQPRVKIGTSMHIAHVQQRNISSAKRDFAAELKRRDPNLPIFNTEAVLMSDRAQVQCAV